MISWLEIVGDIPISDIPINVQHNIEELLKRMNIIRAAWGKPMIVTSGLRSMADHRRIYSKINRQRELGGLAPVRIPMKSNHLWGRACDIADPRGELQAWCLENVKLLEETGLWLEDFSATPTWAHFQTVPPKSGKRFFLP